MVGCVAKPRGGLGRAEMSEVTSLLATFYEQTYADLLGVHGVAKALHGTLAEIATAVDRECIAFRLEIPRGLPIDALQRRADRYRREAGLFERLRAFQTLGDHLRWLHDSVSSLVDLGADDGAMLAAMLGRGWKRLFVGVDPRAMTHQQWGNGNGSAHLVRSLEEAMAINRCYGAAWVAFTLHHIQPAALRRTLLGLSRLLASDGRLFLLEDNPDPPAHAPLEIDHRYASLSERGRALVLRVNDYWSNVIVYGRGHDDQVHGFQAASGWIGLLESCGFHYLTSHETGFNLRRLHGVPSSAIVASRIVTIPLPGATAHGGLVAGRLNAESRASDS